MHACGVFPCVDVCGHVFVHIHINVFTHMSWACVCACMCCICVCVSVCLAVLNKYLDTVFMYSISLMEH